MEDDRLVMTFEQFVNELNRNGKGPEEKGPKTGRKKGDCDDNDDDSLLFDKEKLDESANKFDKIGKELIKQIKQIYPKLKTEAHFDIDDTWFINIPKIEDDYNIMYSGPNENGYDIGVSISNAEGDDILKPTVDIKKIIAALKKLK
jgi:hypothetical protein